MKKQNGLTPRLTHQNLIVLKIFMDRPRNPLCGANLIKLTGLPSGTIYPILFRFEQFGLLESEWEAGKSKILGRPRKRLYRITPSGRELVRKALSPLSLNSSQLIPSPFKA